MNCVNEKNQHVVRWCSQCGAVVIDVEVDNRLMGAVVEMKFPASVGEK